METSRHVGSAAVAGLLGGLLGALAMSLTALGASVLTGGNWYGPLELAGSVATGDGARLQAGLQVTTAIAGLILHLGIGAGWGVLFGIGVAYSAYHLFPREGLWWGALFGIQVWVLDVYVILPLVDPAAAHGVPTWIGALTHVVFGAVVGASFHLMRPHHDAEGRHRVELDEQDFAAPPPTP